MYQINNIAFKINFSAFFLKLLLEIENLHAVFFSEAELWKWHDKFVVIGFVMV